MRLALTLLLFTLSAPCIPADEISNAKTITYCELLDNAHEFEGKMVRIRALYQTDFEQSALTAPSCATSIPLTWLGFDKSWESRTSWRMRHAIRNVHWRVQSDVVLVGKLMTGHSFGHKGMYPFQFEVYKVEAVKPSGSFRPLPVRAKSTL